MYFSRGVFRVGESLAKLRIRAVQAAISALLLLSLPLTVLSQGSQGTIGGAVQDQTSGAIADATVTVTDVARGVSRTIVTDDTGQFVAPSLNPGTYTVRVEAKGFRTVERANVPVEVGQTVRIDILLQPGEQTQTVTVTEELPIINTTDAVLGGTVSNSSIVELPLNGRNFERLLDLRPGNVSTPGAGTGSSSANGRRTASNSLRVEGIAGISNTTGSTILNASYRGGDSSNLLPIDAIQEFNSAYSPKAEYGFRDGSVVNLGIKSGTNSLHGTAYAFGRNAGATDASNAFTGKVTPAFLEQFGGFAGGRIIKDKLFWFAGYEGVRDQNGTTSTTSTPTSVAGAGQGVSMVDTCKALGAANINPLSAQLAGLNPTTCAVSPASSTVENIFPYFDSQSKTYFQSALSSLPLNNGLFKGDYAFSEHHHLSGFLYISKSLSKNVSATNLLPDYYTAGINNAQQYSGAWTWTPGSNWVNDFRMGYVFIRNQTANGDVDRIAGNPWPAGYGMPTGVTTPLYGGLPTIKFNSFDGVLGANARTSSGGPQGDVNLVETLSYLRGKHNFKFGFEYIKLIFNRVNFTNATGTVTFTTLDNFLKGSPLSASIGTGDPSIRTRANWYSGFVQDDWRIKPRLTLNLGLRYEAYTSIQEKDAYMGNFDPTVNPATTPAVQRVGSGQPLKNMFDTGLGYLNPRIGVAWDIQGNGKTVVRAGASLFTSGAPMSTQYPTNAFGASYPSLGINNSGTDANLHSFVNSNYSGATISQIKWNTTANLGSATIFPATSSLTVNGVTYTGAVCTATAKCQVGGLDHDFAQPRSIQWNVDVQRSITSSLSADIAYVGNRGYDEEFMWDLNQPAIGTGYTAAVVNKCIATPSTANCTPDASAITAAQAYSGKFPYLSQIDIGRAGAFANYNALQATLQARNYHGFTFLTAYTYAHTLTLFDTNHTVLGFVMPSDNSSLRLNYGNASYDLRHRFIFSPTYRIPGMKTPAQLLEGWSVNAILTLQPGLSYTISDSTTTDWLGNNGKANGSIGGGVYQYWNFVGPPDAFSRNSAAPTLLTGSAATGDAACKTAAVAPYATGSTQAQLALAALSNVGCYKSGDGILTPPAYGTLGNAGHGFFRGPSYKNVDFSVTKLWKFKEAYSAQFRVEFFNLLNHVNYGAPGADPSKSASFGFSSSTPDSGNAVLGSGGPRHIQFGLKLAF
jgi:hypothetical protein